jgi:hypothetical protein
MRCGSTHLKPDTVVDAHAVNALRVDAYVLRVDASNRGSTGSMLKREREIEALRVDAFKA